MDTTKRSTAVASSRAARQYLRWAKGAVRLWSLFKVIFGIRDFYLHHRDQRQNDACSRLLTSVSETPQGPDVQPARAETAWRKCNEKLQVFTLNCHVQFLNQTCLTGKVSRRHFSPASHRHSQRQQRTAVNSPGKSDQGRAPVLQLSGRGNTHCPIRPEDAQGAQQLHLHIYPEQQITPEAQSLVMGEEESTPPV